MKRNYLAWEQSVLGACLLDKSAFWKIADIVQAQHFSTDLHVRIWDTIKTLATANDDWDGFIVGQAIGNPGYSIELANNTASAANVRGYAEGMVDAWIARQIRVVADQAKILDGSGLEQLSKLQLLVNSITNESGKVSSAREVLREVVAQMQEQCNQNDPISGLRTGFNHFDLATSGLQDGDLIILAGRPSMGKSVMAMQIAMNVALSKKPALVFSLEMTKESCVKRMISSIAEVPHEHVRNASLLDDTQWPKVTAAAQTLDTTPIWFDDSTKRLDAICAKTRQHQMTHGLSLVVIDYLSYMELPKAETQALRIQEATRALKSLAKELSLPVLLVSQINRGVETRSDHRPTLSDLRESGAIEQDADVVIFAYRDDYYDEGSLLKGFAELKIAKQRNGPIVTLPFRHRFDLMRFEEVDELPKQPVTDRPVAGFSKFPSYKARGYAAAQSRANAAGE